MEGARRGRAARALGMAATLALLLLPFAHRVSAGAGGIGLSPASVSISEALRSGEYLSTVTITNLEDSEQPFEFASDGEVGQWATLASADTPEVPVHQIVVPANGQTRLLLRVTIPPNAPNGQHAGTLIFQSVASGSIRQTGSAVSVGLGLQLAANVTGTQRLAGQVEGMTTENVEVDQPPLRVTWTFKNTGNVSAKPLLRLKVRDEKGSDIGEASFSDVAVKPGSAERIQSEWDISGKPAGKYVANAAVTLGETQIDERNLPFEILPKGTLTRSGTLLDFAVEGKPLPNEVTRAVARFQNTGRIDTRAILSAEIYRGTTRVKVVQSLEKMVPLGEFATLDVFFDLPEAGDYTIRGKVNYEGRETETKEATFAVAAVASEAANNTNGADRSTSESLMWVTAVGILVAAAGGLAIGRRAGGKPRDSLSKKPKGITEP